MGCPGIQTWTWTLCVFLSWMCVGQVLAKPYYMVAIPAVLESGAKTKFCVSLLQPNETLHMTVTLKSQKKNTTLLQETYNEAVHTCAEFMAPKVLSPRVQEFEVEVKGETFYSKEIRKVMIKSYQPRTFVQTDKPIYLPGQTVHFRVISLDSRFRPASRLYNVIAIQDNSGNRIGQWLNKTSDGKILQLSYSLNAEAREGYYTVIVSVGNEDMHHGFKVEKYVLPKFDLKIKAADEVSIRQEEIKAEVCATYTYGQPVPGSVEVKMCRPFGRHFHHYAIPDGPDPVVREIEAPCHTEKVQTDMKGCAAFTIKMSTFTKIDEKALGERLTLIATLEEEGTGVLHPQEKRIEISYVVGRLSFIDTPQVYEQGSTVEGHVKAVHYNNTPIPDMPLYLFLGERWAARLQQNLTTDSEGIATFSLNTATHGQTINLHVSSEPQMSYPGYKTAHIDFGHHRMSLAEVSSPDTKSVSSLKVKEKTKDLSCDSEEEISIQYTFAGETQGSVDVIYLVLSRGSLVIQGSIKAEVQDKPVTEGVVSFMLKMDREMAPDVQVVVYTVLPSETMIADSADFATEKCFSHKVSLEFSPSSAVPGEETTMQVTAQPHSLCGVSAVDQSVLIMEPGKTLNADKIFDLLPVRKVSQIPYEVQDPSECMHVRPRRYVLPHPSEEDDAHTVFENVGLKMATNLLIRIPSCLKFKGREYYHGRGHYDIGYRYHDPPVMSRVQMGSAGPMGGNGGALADAPPIKTVRTFFPETWIWDLVEVGESGKKDVSLTVPDTITTWETEAFCLSSEGFGLAPREEIKVFQPFFLELTLPYSIIRGEDFELKATVFNYLSSCIMIKVVPKPSLDYTLTPLTADLQQSCLCGNERKTLSWTMAPSALGVVNVTVTAEAVVSDVMCGNEIVSVPQRGRVDVVTRSLIVKAEGTEVAKTYNWLMCPTGEAISEEKDIELPSNVIDGSARASVSVLGDILGRAMKNLDGLLQMPYGCGEQNMALLAPNIYILQYLKNTQQLTPGILEKATKFLTSGYQRQLNYKHSDGAYSTFGTGDGNTWLTAFVLRTFSKAQSFVYIDPENIKESKLWLDLKQQDNGCFTQIGKLFNNRMKGGVSDEVTLSAYITAAFLETNNSIEDPVVNKSLSCLRAYSGDFSNTYTTALLAYVFTLAGDMENRDRLLKHLDTSASHDSGFLHWSQTADDTSMSLSVEISSYVLLAKLSTATVTPEDLGYASRIVRWLTGQQNYYGGFSSTQDTVVALQALALYSSLVFSPKGSSTVMVQSPSSQLTFDVNENNKLVYQEKTLEDVTGKYNLEVKGTACAAVQISVHYNIPTPKIISTVSVEVDAEAVCTSTKSHRPKLTLKLKALYDGAENISNMLILDIKQLSGFVPDPESLKRLRGSLLVDRVEQKEDHVLVYIREFVKGNPINYQLELVQEVPVQKLKPAVIKIYDYYQPEDQSETDYSYPCTA